MLTTARSVRPSPLKSAATTDQGAGSVGIVAPWVNVPSPRPSKTCTSSPYESVTARSGWPSPLIVADRHARRTRARRDLNRGLEGAVAVAQQDRHVVRTQVGGDDVLYSVAGQVGGRHEDWIVSYRQRDRGLKGAVAGAHVDQDLIDVEVRHDEVGDLVAGEVGDGDGIRATVSGRAAPPARSRR